MCIVTLKMLRLYADHKNRQPHPWLAIFNMAPALSGQSMGNPFWVAACPGVAAR